MRKVCHVALLVVALVAVPVLALANAQVEITFWHHWDGERMSLVQEMLDAFMEHNPDIHVTQLLSPPRGTADQLMTFLLGGSAPDVVMVNSSFGIQISRMGGFMPLGALLERDGIDLGMFNDADLGGFQVDGETYALPAMSGIAWTNLMFYNRTLLAEAGLNPDSPPRTWTEWRSASQRLMRRDLEGNIIQGGTAIPEARAVTYWNGGSLWSEDWRTATVNTPRVQEAAEFLHDLMATQYENRTNYTNFFGSGFTNAFYRGQMGFWRQNSAAFAHLPTFDIDWGVALVPVNDAHPDARPVGLVESTWAYAIPSFISPEKAEAAWRLLKWITTEEDGGGWFARVQGRPSPVMSFNTHPDYIYDNPHWGVVIESANYVELAPPVNLGVTSVYFNDIVLNGNNPQQALEQAEVALQNELDRYWEGF